MPIPDQYKPFCYAENKVLACDYYMDAECPNTCDFARRIKQGISHKARTGLERFLDKFPRWGGNNKKRLGFKDLEYCNNSLQL